MRESILVAAGPLVVSAGLIYFACVFFVNGVEWLGLKTGVGRTAVGSVLAAFGTALPESIVTLVAVVSHDDVSKDIGVGAALGGPLVLGTIAYSVVGLSILATSNSTTTAKLAFNRERLSRDQAQFLLIFAVKVTLGLVAFTLKPLVGFLFLVAYARYFWKELRAGGEEEHLELEPLKLRPDDDDPALAWIIVQTATALLVIFGAADLFVDQLGKVGQWLDIPPTVVALLLSPIATELPETMNAIIWIRQGKQGLAVANISGAMMIQATVPSAFGLFFTPWLFDSALMLSAAITTISVLGLFRLLRRDALTAGRLSLFGLLYGVFALGLLVLLS